MEQTRERLIRAGEALFAQYGLEGTGVRQLAIKAGVNPALVNYHFGSKQGLFEAVIRGVRGRWYARLSEADTMSERGFKRMFNLWRVWKDLVMQDASARELLYGRLNPLHDAITTARTAIESPIRGAVREAIRESGSGAYREDEIITVMFGTTLAAAVYLERGSDYNRTEEIMLIIMSGLGLSDDSNNKLIDGNHNQQQAPRRRIDRVAGEGFDG